LPRHRQQQQYRARLGHSTHHRHHRRIGALALTLSCTVLPNTQVRLGRRESDTDTTIDLVCNFQ